MAIKNFREYINENENVNVNNNAVQACLATSLKTYIDTNKEEFIKMLLANVEQDTLLGLFFNDEEIEVISTLLTIDSEAVDFYNLCNIKFEESQTYLIPTIEEDLEITSDSLVYQIYDDNAELNVLVFEDKAGAESFIADFENTVASYNDSGHTYSGSATVLGTTPSGLVLVEMSD